MRHEEVKNEEDQNQMVAQSPDKRSFSREIMVRVLDQNGQVKDTIAQNNYFRRTQFAKPAAIYQVPSA